QVIGVEPEGSVVADYWRSGRLGTEGTAFLNEEIGANQPPEALATDVLDDVVRVSDRRAVAMARLLARREGILTGGAGGAVVEAALAWASARELEDGSMLVCLIPDHGARYL